MNLLIRADAGARIGAGHMMRCLALAQACQDSGGIPFVVTATEAPALEARMRSEGLEVVRLRSAPGGSADAQETAALARNRSVSWVVLDGYHFTADYHGAIRETGSRLLALDDNCHLDRYEADVLLNLNIDAEPASYRGKTTGKTLLLGCRYALLRREFRAWPCSERRTDSEARRVLVTLGGGDLENVTLKVLQALDSLSVAGLEARVVVGPANPHLDLLERAAAAASFPAEIRVNPPDMADLMAWADLAVSASGGTSWELAYMGVPQCAIVLAENQRAVGRRLHDEGISVPLGWFRDVTVAGLARQLTEVAKDEERRRVMSRRGRALIDGRGAERVLEALGRESLGNPGAEPEA